MKTFFLSKWYLPLALAAVFVLGWYLGSPSKEPAVSTEEDATLWTCSMHPQIRQPNPGLCPICAMDLIPLEAGGADGLREVSVNRDAAALMDLRVSPVVRRPATVHVDLFGKIAYDERRVNTTTARMGGRLDRFYVDYTGTEVRQGDHIAEIYSPELFVAQQDLIKAVSGLKQARRAGTPASVETQERLARSARERLRLLQLTEAQIDAIAEQNEPRDQITLYAPQDGVVTKRHVMEGAYVKTGDPLFSVADLQSVWLQLEAYESDLPWLKFAQDVAFTVEAIPGETFHGRIAYIDPEIDPMRRVVNVRVNVPNERRLLKPGMFARARVDAQVAADGSVIDAGLAGKWISPMHPEVMSDGPGQCTICGMDLVPAEELGFIKASGDAAHGDPLLVPASAVLQTGERAVVYVRVEGAEAPTFEGREIVLGSRVGLYFFVESGLTEGEMVVTQGAFKLDSELQIQAKPSMMNRNAGLVESPAVEAEAVLTGQWMPVPRALGRLERAARQGNAEGAREALNAMRAAIEQVETEALTEATLATWEEFERRLKNALTLAQEAPPLQAYEQVTRAVAEAGRYLGLPYQPADAGPAPDPEALAALREALAAYYPLAEALAADDQDAAFSARAPLVEAVSKAALPSALGNALTEAKDIVELRTAFQPVSDALIALIQERGLDRVGDAFVIHCPMAFDNTGADWLSPKTDVLNPYFGAEMLHCGAVRAKLSVESNRPLPPAETPSAEAPAHQH